MNFKKKRRFADLLRAALVVILFVGVPIWLFMIMVILKSGWVAFALICWVSLSYIVCGRFE